MSAHEAGGNGICRRPLLPFGPSCVAYASTSCVRTYGVSLDTGT